MADDIGFQPIQQQSNDDVGFQPIPKIPDTSGVQKMAQDNLAANDDKAAADNSQPKQPQSPMERTNTAAGFPVDKVINGTASPSDFDAQHRAQYVKALDNGSAINGSDWLPTMLRSIAPIIAGGIQRAEHPIDFAEEAGSDVLSGFKGGASLLMYPYLSDANKEDLLKNNQLSDYQNPNTPANTEIVRRGIELEQATVGRGMGGLYAPLGVISPIISPIIQNAGGTPTKQGEIPTWKSLVPGAIGVAMDVAGGLGIIHGANELSAVRDATAKKLDIDPAAVTPAHVDQVIADGAKNTHPSGQDFKDVSTVTNIPESSLKIVFKETGVKPDQIFADAQRDPTIAADVAAGKVPEQYEHLVEEKPAPSEERVEKLNIARDEAARSFTVVDKDGDHVQGGFDSHEEAQHYIQDEKFKAEERAAIASDGKENTKLLESEKTQDVLTPEDAEATLQPKQARGIYADVEKKVDSMTSEERNTRLQSLNKKMEAAIITPKEMAEREALSAKLRQEKINEKVPASISAEGGMGNIPIGSEVNPPENVGDNAANKNSSETPSKSQLSKTPLPPSKIGKPTSLYTFLRNNGGLKDEGGNLTAMDEKSLIRKNGMQWDDATELAHQHGYFPERPSIPELQDKLFDTNGGRDHYRDQDTDRQIKTKENAQARRENDPTYIEDYADKLGIDATRKPEETDRQFISRLKDSIKEFYKNTEGSGVTPRQMIGDAIIAAEKFAGKLAGGFFQKLADGYIKTFQPELMGDMALRADAYLAKFKTKLQEAENAYYRQSEESKAAFDKLTPNERLQWLYDHETGRWDEELDTDHARYQALYDAMHEAEQKAIGADTAYKENYLPHQWEKPDAVSAFFRSEGMIKKYGADWFKKASEFKLIQEGIRAGFKLKTDNPESMLVARQLASYSMIATMDLLKDMESSGLAKRATAFGIDKKITKTENQIAELQEKYKKEFEKKNNPNQPALIDGLPPAENKIMKVVEERLNDLKARLDAFTKEKTDNKLTPEQMKELKSGFRVIGPDSKVWNIHQQVGPLWKNAIEMKGLWENQGVLGDAYRGYIQSKAIWTQAKLALSLFHPVHVAMINLASGIANVAEHLIQGGKLSDVALKDTGLGMGITKETFKMQDHPAVQAWNTAAEARTPEQHATVAKMLEGGFKPTMSARDTVHFKENFDKAIAGIGINNLRLIGSAISLPGLLMKPFFEHWIPGMKSEIYLRRCDDAIARDPSLANDAGRRGEAFRQIAKDTDRTYGEMNNDVQFWNRNVRDSFNAAFISGGWKLAQIYNAKGLLEPGKIAYKFAKTGEFSKSDITYNMLQAYTYTGLTLALGGAINTMLGNPIGSAKDTVWDMVKNLVAPQTGDKNPDGTPIRLNQPAFAKEAYNIAHEINTKGLFAGSGSFLYHQTLIPGIVDTLTNRDFSGHELISDPTDLHQWMNAGWDTITPISLSQYERSEEKQSKVGEVAGLLGFPTAGSYINQTPFEQKVIAKFDEQNPPKGSAYEVKLKTDLKSQISKGDNEDAEKTKQRMKEEGMSDKQISAAEKIYTKPFVEDAWKKLPAEDQKRIIESASDEEKKKFKVKSQ